MTDRENRYGLKTKTYSLADASNYNDLNATVGVIKMPNGYKLTYRLDVFWSKDGSQMKIESKKLTVRELFEDYSDDGEGGVRGYGGKLDIRPSYQHEFIYKDKKRDVVIKRSGAGFP